MRTIHLFLLGLMLSMAAWAQSTDTALTDAEVRKIDRDAGKITLKHGEIKNLDMPPMTMVFRVKDAGMLDKARVGEKVRFAAQKIDGNYVVTEIIPIP